MTIKITMTFLVLFAIVSGIVAITPSVQAETVIVSAPAGSSVPGCEETNECFIPEDVTVNVGDEVTWSNDDTAAHTVTSGSAADGPDGNFDSSLFMAATTFSVTFDEAGTYPYFCMVHPWMVGTVIVQEAGAEEEMMAEETMAEEEMMADKIMVAIETGMADAGEMLTIDVTFTDMDSKSVEHGNYDIMATQGDEVILDDKGVHSMDGTGSHTTMALPMAASDAMPVDVTVTFNGMGVNPPFTGPIGQVAEKQVVPEFGTIAVMILGVAIVSIIAFSARSKLMLPKL